MDQKITNDDPPKIETAKNNSMTFSLNLRWLSIFLIGVIVVMLFIWRPWTPNPDAKNRIVTVTGETTVTAVPDEYVFQPGYQFKNADKAAALSEVTKKSDEVIKKLKSLGVADNKIKSDAGGYEYSYYYDSDSKQSTYSLRLTVTVDSKAMAQKVQDYLVSTSPTGTVSPQASFSTKLRKDLENKARDDAAKDARAKAERTAQNLGFSLGKVKTISDVSGVNSPIFYGDLGATSLSAGDSVKSPSLSVQPGENELPYSITVVYYVND